MIFAIEFVSPPRRGDHVHAKWARTKPAVPVSVPTLMVIAR
jgi:hypothetical protein